MFLVGGKEVLWYAWVGRSKISSPLASWLPQQRKAKPSLFPHLVPHSTPSFPSPAFPIPFPTLSFRPTLSLINLSITHSLSSPGA